MATSKMNKSGLQCEIIWSNSNISQAFDEQTISTGATKKYKFVVVKYNQYKGGVYNVNAVYSPTGEATGNTFDNNTIVSSRWDGNSNYIIGRQTAYRFSDNSLYVAKGYRQDTYKTSVADNYALIPYVIVGYY